MNTGEGAYVSQHLFVKPRVRDFIGRDIKNEENVSRDRFSPCMLIKLAKSNMIIL